MHRLPNLQLNNPQCMQILRTETAPGASRNETTTPVPGTGAQQPGCPIFLLCGILWLVLCQCCQRLLRPGRRKGKGQSPDDTKGRKPGPHSGDSPRVRPSQRGVPEPVVTQRSQPGARLDSAIAKQRKAEAKVQKCKEAASRPKRLCLLPKKRKRRPTQS